MKLREQQERTYTVELTESERSKLVSMLAGYSCWTPPAQAIYDFFKRLATTEVS